MLVAFTLAAGGFALFGRHIWRLTALALPLSIAILVAEAVTAVGAGTVVGMLIAALAFVASPIMIAAMLAGRRGGSLLIGACYGIPAAIAGAGIGSALIGRMHGGSFAVVAAMIVGAILAVRAVCAAPKP